VILRGHKGIVNSAAFSTDRTRVVTASHDKTARIWDAATGNEIIVLWMKGCCDVVEVEVSEIGVLRTPIVDEKA
jgi:WD40 repeat protein